MSVGATLSGLEIVSNNFLPDSFRKISLTEVYIDGKD